MIYICTYIFFSDKHICKKLSISDTQIEWVRAGGGKRETKLVLLRFRNYRSAPQKTILNLSDFLFGVRCCILQLGAALQLKMLELLNPFLGFLLYFPTASTVWVTTEHLKMWLM